MPFRTLTWLATWWKHYGQDDSKLRKRLFVLVVRNSELAADQQVLGIAPWYIEQTRTRGGIVRWLGSGEVCTDHCTLLCQPEDRPAVVEALAKYLATHDSWNRLSLDAVDEADPTMAALAERLAERGCTVSTRPEGNCWSIPLPDSWDEFLAMMSKSHRKQLRRLDRNVLSTDRAVWSTVESPEQLAELWPTFVDLHQRRRQSLGEPGCFASPRFAAFHREVAGQLLAAGQLRMACLQLDGKPIAVEYHFAGPQCVYAYQGGVDPDRLDEEPGRLSLIATLRDAMAADCRSLDLLRGDEPYKPHWRAVPHPTYRLQVLAPSHRGNWLAQTADLAESFAAGIKSSLRPLMGSLESRFTFFGL